MLAVEAIGAGVEGADRRGRCALCRTAPGVPDAHVRQEHASQAEIGHTTAVIGILPVEEELLVEAAGALEHRTGRHQA